MPARTARRRAAPASALAALLLAACAARAGGVPPRAPLPRPAEVAARYAAPGGVPAADMELLEASRARAVLRVALPARFAPDAPPEAREPIRLRWFRPCGEGARPAVLVSPILGSETDVVAWFCERFAREGWHALLVARPEVTFEAGRPVSQVEDRLRASVSRQVQALDWLLAQPGVDPARLATFGVSAGGIQSAMVAGVDDRYAAHVLGLAGGPLADVICDSSEKKLRRLVERGMKEQGLSRDALRERLRAEIRTDPVLLAPYVRSERVLLILAEHDASVPTACGRRLFEALGRPQTVWLPLGHYTSAIALPGLEARTVEFLRQRFDEATPAR